MNATELHLLERMASAAERSEDKVGDVAEQQSAIRAAQDAEARARSADHAVILAEVRSMREQSISKTELRAGGAAALIVLILLILLLAESRGVDTRAAVEGTTTIIGAAQESEP